MENFTDRFDEKLDDDDAPCFIYLIEKEPIDESFVEISERLLGRLIQIGIAYDLRIISMMDTLDDTYLNRYQCDSLMYELDFVMDVVNDVLLHKKINEIKKIVNTCRTSKKYILVVGGN